jgi:hypothetical protein
VAPVGLWVIAQEKDTIPAYPLVELTVTVEVADPPGFMVTPVAAMEYDTAVTVTEVVAADVL